VNPFNGARHIVSLRKQDVSGIVFWSRNYKSVYDLIDKLREDGYPMIFHLTLTNYNAPFETNVPLLEDSISQFKYLSGQFSDAHTIWRYDPIIISSITDASFHVENFKYLCMQLEKFTRRCYFSFLQFYRKVKSKLTKLTLETGIEVTDPCLEEKITLAGALREIAGKHEISFHACCNPELHDTGFQKASCVDAELLQTLYPSKEIIAKPNPLRKGCGCYDSRDIGTYDTCLAGCSYCYATSSTVKSNQNRQNPNP
jgi:hypothetical protein